MFEPQVGEICWKLGYDVSCGFDGCKDGPTGQKMGLPVNLAMAVDITHCYAFNGIHIFDDFSTKQ